VIGAGAWGTALAHSAASQPIAPHAVTLWARNSTQVERLRTEGGNSGYLPGVALSPRLAYSNAPLAPLAQQHDLVVIATPMAALREVLVQLGALPHPVVWLCKGFEAHSALLGHEVFQNVHGPDAEQMGYGVLSGPSFALEVANGQPTALVAASPQARVQDTLVEAFHANTLRVYRNPDIVGVEVGGAVKNVLAIATGLCDGLGLGLNARAALITRGLAEITRLGVALGGLADTFMGLSGLGDLVLTATGHLSRNRQVGLLLAQGQSLEAAVASLGHVAEGVNSARTVLARAKALHVEMPITASVVAVLDGRLSPQQAVADLMGREPVAETD
jgi:glycerol-3-phosphate dehydrogenase (NAD(P)+)